MRGEGEGFGNLSPSANIANASGSSKNRIDSGISVRMLRMPQAG